MGGGCIGIIAVTLLLEPNKPLADLSAPITPKLIESLAALDNGLHSLSLACCNWLL